MEKNKNLIWKEIFKPSHFEKIVPTESEFDCAWNWLFSNKETVPMLLSIVRKRSLILRKTGEKIKEAEIALFSLYRQYGIAMKSIPKRSL